MKKPEPGVCKDKKRGTWLYALDVPSIDGKRRQELRRGFATMDDANAAIKKRREELNAGLIPIPPTTASPHSRSRGSARCPPKASNPVVRVESVAACYRRHPGNRAAVRRDHMTGPTRCSPKLMRILL